MKDLFVNADLVAALEAFTSTTNRILGSKVAMICLFGSIMYGDLSPGYGDLDFHCLVHSPLSQGEIDNLFQYRGELKSSTNVFLKMLEGEFAPVELCRGDKTGRVAYWGTSRVKVFDRITVRTFSLQGLIENGIVIYGEDLRHRYEYPTKEQMIDDVKGLISNARTYASKTDGDLHSVDWIFLICQSLYWLANDHVTSKSKAAQWVYDHNKEDWVRCIPTALELRRNPSCAEEPFNREWLSNLGPYIQQACIDLDSIMLRQR